MHKLMCTFMTPMKKKIPDRNLDTSCPAGIPCNKKGCVSRVRKCRKLNNTQLFTFTQAVHTYVKPAKFTSVRT